MLTLTLILTLNCYNAFPMPASKLHSQTPKYLDLGDIHLESILYRYCNIYRPTVTLPRCSGIPNSNSKVFILHPPISRPTAHHRTIQHVPCPNTEYKRIRGCTTMRYINLRFTYLLTYLPTGSSKMFSVFCEMSLSTAGASGLSVACSMHVINQDFRTLKTRRYVCFYSLEA